MLGTGGTTLAILLAERNMVYLWTRTAEEAQEINQKRENVSYLQGVPLPSTILVEIVFNRAIEPEDIVLLAIPSRKIEEFFRECASKGYTRFTLVNASKGVEVNSLKTIQQTAKEILPQLCFVNLSGPTIAKEIAQGLPAKAILASENVDVLFKVADIFRNGLLQFSYSTDVKGIELASAMKGLIAIGIGLADGCGFKTNIFGLIMTYGLQEFTKVMEFLGVNTSTVYGIAGAGDLITTCLSENSRNRRFGYYLAIGQSREQALQSVGMEVEGVSMAKTVQKLTAFQLSIPLISFITRVIFDEIKDIKRELIQTLNAINN